MLSRQRFDEAAFRLVDYHLVLLKEIKEDFQQGRLKKQQDFEKHWSQIKQSHQFMTERLAHDSLAADYCIQYVLTSYEFLYAWRDLNETLSWVEIGIKASQQLDNQQMIALMNHQISLYFTSRQLILAHEKIELLFEIAKKDNESLAKAHALLHRGRYYLTQGLYDNARHDLEESSALYKKLNLDAQYGWALHNLGSVAEQQDDLETARSYLEQALKSYQTPQELRRIILAQSRLGSIIEQQGNQALGYEYADQALKSAYQLQDNMLIISSLLNVAIIVWQGGQKSLSLAYYEEATLLSRKIGSKPHLGISLMNLGYIYSEQGDFIRSEQHYAESMTTYLNLQYERRARVAQAYLSFAMIMNNKLPSALEHLKVAWQFGIQVGDQAICGLALIALMAYKVKCHRHSEVTVCFHAIKKHHPHDDVGDSLKIFKIYHPDFVANLVPTDSIISLEDLYHQMDGMFTDLST